MPALNFPFPAGFQRTTNTPLDRWSRVSNLIDIPNEAIYVGMETIVVTGVEPTLTIVSYRCISIAPSIVWDVIENASSLLLRSSNGTVLGPITQVQPLGNISVNIDGQFLVPLPRQPLYLTQLNTLIAISGLVIGQEYVIVPDIGDTNIFLNLVFVAKSTNTLDTITFNSLTENKGVHINTAKVYRCNLTSPSIEEVVVSGSGSATVYATNAEALAGTIADKSIAPLSLIAWWNNRKTLLNTVAVSFVNGLQGFLNDKADQATTYTKTENDNTFDTKADVTHSHAIADVDSLQDKLNEKSEVNHTHVIADVSGLQAAIDTKASVSHAHIIADVTGLSAALTAKSDTSHGHVIGNVSGLQVALDAKVATTLVGAASGIATLDSTTRVPRAQTAEDALYRAPNLDFIVGALIQKIPLRSSATVVRTLTQIGCVGTITFQLQGYPSEASIGATVTWDGATGTAAAAITALNSRLSAISPAVMIRLQTTVTSISGTIGSIFMDHLPN